MSARFAVRRALALLALASGAAACAGPSPGSPDEDGLPSIESICDAELADFRASVWEPILSVQCIGCHNAAGPAGNSRMVLQPDTEEGFLENNLAQVLRVANVPAADRPLLLAMPSDENPERKHPGGAVLPADSTGYSRLAGFVARLSSPECDAGETPRDCSTQRRLPRRLWRLTPVQFDNTITTLTGVQSTFGRSFPADTVVDGFDDNAEELLVTPLFADKLMTAAEEIAAKVDLARISPCTSGETCARDFIVTFGQRAFRRPLNEGDITRYLALFAGSGDFSTGARLVVTAMLQSPHFLYRRELGDAVAPGAYTLTDYEVASELSYLIWNDMPDDALFDAARGGQLHTDAQIAAEAERLLASPRARPVLRRFLFQWLGIGTLSTVPKDSQAFPTLTPEVRASLTREAELVIDRVVFDGSSRLPDLIQTPDTFLDATLAAFYGVSVPATAANTEGYRAVTLPASQRQGVLTLGGVMLAHARSNDSSPVHRGRLVRDRFLCQPPEPPPPGINAQPPPLDPDLTARERYAAHAAMEPCLSCHRLMDPIGFAFEHYDGAGRYRETDNGNAIDDSGEILSSARTAGTFQGTQELAGILAGSEDVADCFALQWFRYGAGYRDSVETECVVEDLQRGFRAQDLSIRGLVIALTRSSHFTTRAGSSEPPPPPVEPPPQPPDAGTVDAGRQPEPPPPDEGITLERIVDNDYGSGYCHTYRVTNSSDSPVEWSVSLTIDGTLMQHWESEVVREDTAAIFSGAAHNRTLAPGESAQFGFCVTR